MPAKLVRPKSLPGSPHVLEGSLSHLSGAILSSTQKREVLRQLQVSTHLSAIKLENSDWNPFVRQAISNYVAELEASGLVKQSKDSKGRFAGFELDVESE